MGWLPPPVVCSHHLPPPALSPAPTRKGAVQPQPQPGAAARTTPPCPAPNRGTCAPTMHAAVGAANPPHTPDELRLHLVPILPRLGSICPSPQAALPPSLQGMLICFPSPSPYTAPDLPSALSKPPSCAPCCLHAALRLHACMGICWPKYCLHQADFDISTFLYIGPDVILDQCISVSLVNNDTRSCCWG